MPTLPLLLAPSMLVLFMVALAVIPLLIVLVDDNRRAVDAARLQRLRGEAGLRAVLTARVEASGPTERPGVSVPNA